MDPMIIASGLYALWAGFYWFHYLLEYQPPGTGEIENWWVRLDTKFSRAFKDDGIKSEEISGRYLMYLFTEYRYTDSHIRWPWYVRAYATLIRPRGRLVLRKR